MNDNNDIYYCADCGQHFGDIPALGCPYCNSDNYYPTESMVAEAFPVPELVTAK